MSSTLTLLESLRDRFDGVTCELASCRFRDDADDGVVVDMGRGEALEGPHRSMISMTFGEGSETLNLGFDPTIPFLRGSAAYLSHIVIKSCCWSLSLTLALKSDKARMISISEIGAGLKS